jgi:hypothetical protein
VSALNVFVILTVFFAGAGYLTVVEKDVVSFEENRLLAAFPEFSLKSYITGDYAEGIARFVDDTVPGRSTFKRIIASNILNLKGKRYGDEGVVIYGWLPVSSDDSEPEPSAEAFANETVFPKAEPFYKAAGTDAVSPIAETEETPAGIEAAADVSAAVETVVTEARTESRANPAEQTPDGDGMVSNSILVINNRGVMLYGGGKRNGRQYAEYLNAYKRDLGEGVNVYSLVCPTPVSFYMPEKYKHLSASERDNVDNINAYLKDVIPVDAITELDGHKDENIYARTDHHWLPLGAFYAARAFAETAGVPFAELNGENFDTVTLSEFVGTLYGFTQNADLVNNPEEFTYFIPKTATLTTRYSTAFTNPRGDSLLYNPRGMSRGSYYMVFGGDAQISHISTSTENGRNLIIFKDSYGNALVPALVNSFENIYLCDVRYFELNAVEFIKSVGGTDVLFAMCSFSATGVNYKHIETNRVRMFRDGQEQVS